MKEKKSRGFLSFDGLCHFDGSLSASLSPPIKDMPIASHKTVQHEFYVEDRITLDRQRFTNRERERKPLASLYTFTHLGMISE